MTKAPASGPGGVPIHKMGPSFDIGNSVQIWHGPPKTGKTSTAAALGEVAAKYDLDINPFFLLTEPGSGGVSCHATCQSCSSCGGSGKNGRSKCDECDGTGVVRKVLDTIEEVREWLEWFAGSDFNICVIDTMDRLFQIVSDDVCVTLGLPNPHNSDHGIAWTMIYDEIRELLSIPVAADKGVIMIMHVYMQERRVKGGSTTVATFNVPGKSRQYLAGLANQILFFDIVPHEKEDRDKYVIFARPQSGVEAGDHWNLFPPELDRGANAEEAAEAILTCFGYLEE